jgi:phosphate transport system substrate-binding protein
MQTRSSETLLRRTLLLGTFGGTTLGLIALAPRRAAAAEITLLETGSSLLYPLFNLWVPKYTATHQGLRITTQATGSGTGIAQAVSGVAQIGASDAYMSSAQLKKNPSILNIPLAISAQTVNYNVPGLNNANLKLSGPVLAGIYSGKITHWNDPAIAKINSGVTLPNQGIVPIHRTDGSGDTFIFSQYLSASTPDWANNVGYGTTLSWPPVQGGIGAIGNPGMVQACGQTSGSLAYIGVSYHAQITKAGLGTAMLQNRAGNFVLPNPTTVGGAAAALVDKTPTDQRISLIFAPGENSYPIINYEYAIVNSKQASPNVAAALRDFLTWAVDPAGGNAAEFLDVVQFLPLPEKIAALSKAQIAKIQ